MSNFFFAFESFYIEVFFFFFFFVGGGGGMCSTFFFFQPVSAFLGDKITIHILFITIYILKNI